MVTRQNANESANVTDVPTARRIAPVEHNPAAVKYAREQAEWSQTGAAKQLGIARSLLSEIEAGTRGASVALRRKMAALYNCPLSILAAPREDTN